MAGKPGAVELAQRAEACPKCHAPAGERCTGRSGGTRSYSHQERYDLAVAAGRLPLPDEEPGFLLDEEA